MDFTRGRRGFMSSRRNVLLGLIGIAISDTAVAAEPSAQDFLAAIYAAYKGKDAKGIRRTGRGATARYFSPSLARLIDADARAAAKRGDLPNLSSDPFIDAQDFEIAAVAIEVRAGGPDRAVGTVKFKNMDENVTVTLDLVRLKDGWRIDEIRAPSGSLRAVFKKK